jgi:hypothetical protein
MSTKFYHYPQNNSGGCFVEDENAGLCGDVIIEAHDAEQANTIAETKGIYFGGYSKIYGFDCSCCGERWHRRYESDGEDSPHIFSTKLEDKKKGWGSDYCFVHYLNGEIKKVVFND